MPAEDVSGTLMNIASGEESPLGSLLKSGDVDKAATMAYAVLSMVDTSEGQMGSDDKKSVSKVIPCRPCCSERALIMSRTKNAGHFRNRAC